MELWKAVPEWEQYYEVSNYGRFRSIRTNKIKALDVNSYGYARANMYDGTRKKRCFLHKLVAELFVSGYKEGYVVDHIDGDKSNNMYTNLEWVSRSENTKRAFRTGLKKAERITIPCYLHIKETDHKIYFKSIVDAAKSIGLSDKRLHHLIKNNDGYIPEVNMYIHKCVSND